MLVLALVVTFGTASVLQVMAVASSHKAPATVVVEAAKPTTKAAGGKERTVSVREGNVIRAASAL